MDYSTLITQIIKGNRRAQRDFYDEFSGAMYSICLRYARSKEDAEDIFQHAFLKSYQKIQQIKDAKALPGWMKSLFVRECLDYYKASHQKQQFTEIHDDILSGVDLNAGLESLSMDELRKEINKLPDKCRLVFNMYVIDGYNHSEIGKTLGISEGTSKSQLFEAKKRLKIAITQMSNYIKSSNE